MNFGSLAMPAQNMPLHAWSRRGCLVGSDLLWLLKRISIMAQRSLLWTTSNQEGPHAHVKGVKLVDNYILHYSRHMKCHILHIAKSDGLSRDEVD